MTTRRGAASTAPAPPASPASADAGAANDDPERVRAEEAFLAWLADPAKPDITRIDGEAATPLTRLLGRLSLSPRPLPLDAASTLGLTGAATVGDAATELLLAVSDPAGPRCRSFRSAALYLRDLHELSAAFEEQ